MKFFTTLGKSENRGYYEYEVDENYIVVNKILANERIVRVTKYYPKEDMIDNQLLSFAVGALMGGLFILLMVVLK